MTNVILAWVFLGNFLGGIIQIIFATSESMMDEISFSCAFYFTTYFYNNYKDELNTAGLVLAIACIVIATLPGSVLILLFLSLKELLVAIWQLFKFIFRKKENKDEAER